MFDKANGNSSGVQTRVSEGHPANLGTYTPVSRKPHRRRGRRIYTANSAPVTVRFSNLAGIATAADDAPPLSRAQPSRWATRGQPG